MTLALQRSSAATFALRWHARYCVCSRCMSAAYTCTPCKRCSPQPTSHAGCVQLWASWLRQAAPITLQPQGLAAARAMSTGAISLSPSKWAVVRSASGQLPVYRDIRNANSREITVIRKVLGDLHALRATIVSEFQVIPRNIVSQVNPSSSGPHSLARTVANQVDAKNVWVKAGRVEVKGRHKREIAQWLESKGF